MIIAKSIIAYMHIVAFTTFGNQIYIGTTIIIG